MAMGPYINMFLGNNFALNPLILDLVIKAGLICGEDATTSQHAELLTGILKNIKILVGVEGLFFFAFLIGLMFSPQHKIHGFLITWWSVSIWNAIYSAIGIAIIGCFTWLSNYSVIFLILGVLLASCYLLFYISLSSIWMLGLVVSEEEEDCYGDYAIAKAVEISKRGSSAAISLTFQFTLAASGITGILGFLMSEVKLSLMAQLVTGMVLINITRLLSSASLAAFKVLYYQVKMSHDNLIQVQEGAGYSIPPPIDPQVRVGPY